MVIHIILLIGGRGITRFIYGKYSSLGGLGVAWFILWMIFTADNPEKHRFISEEEKDLIVSAVSEVKDKQTITVSSRYHTFLR